MNEVEKLRTMLKRARPNLFCSCDTCKELRDSIDAALAEPVADLTTTIDLLIDERDEARAEVKRLKTQYEMLGTLAYADVEVAEAKAKTAYQRGAEAMREVAVQYLRTTGWFMNQQVACSISVLPLPDNNS